MWGIEQIMGDNEGVFVQRLFQCAERLLVHSKTCVSLSFLGFCDLFNMFFSGLTLKHDLF